MDTANAVDEAPGTREEPSTTAHPDLNEVVLSGRLSVAPEVRELPSGRALTTFRLIVRRPDGAAEYARPGGKTQSVDVIECSVWHPGLAAKLGDLAPGDPLTVRGSLRRRFSRSERGLTSWVNVEVIGVERLATEADAG